MSECVVRMKMPNGCHDCKLRSMVGNCPIPMFDGQDEKKIWTLEECFQRPPWCPIVCSLPEGHGRLVDAEKLKERSVHFSETGYAFDFDTVFIEDINKASTIVPADTEERSET